MNAEIEPHILKMFEIKKRIGKGAYGIVWKALNKKTKEIIALKKIFDAFRNQTDAQRTFREIAFLQNFGNHPNIVRLYNVIRASSDKDIYLVFEYMETDLHNVIKKGNILNDIHKQYIMYQLLKATAYLHSGEVIHRDQKPSNVLLNSYCLVKLCDFGLARSLKGRNKYENVNGKLNCKTLLPALTEYVATRWYRAPEILLACHNYTKGVDIWSLGCILGEMLIGTPLFPGTSTLDQIERIMGALPKPTIEDMASVKSPYSSSILQKAHIKNRRSLDQLLINVDKTATDLMYKMLHFNPHKRITALEALKHPYVRRFYSPNEIMIMNHHVTPPLDDNIQLTVSEYRDRLYQMISSKKTNTTTTIMIQNGINKTDSTERKNIITGIPQSIPCSTYSHHKKQSTTKHNPSSNHQTTIIKGQDHHHDLQHHHQQHQEQQQQQSNEKNTPQSHCDDTNSSKKNHVVCVQVNLLHQGTQNHSINHDKVAILTPKLPAMSSANDINNNNSTNCNITGFNNNANQLHNGHHINGNINDYDYDDNVNDDDNYNVLHRSASSSLPSAIPSLTGAAVMAKATTIPLKQQYQTRSLSQNSKTNSNLSTIHYSPVIRSNSVNKMAMNDYQTSKRYLTITPLYYPNQFISKLDVVKSTPTTNQQSYSNLNYTTTTATTTTTINTTNRSKSSNSQSRLSKQSNRNSNRNSRITTSNYYYYTANGIDNSSSSLLLLPNYGNSYENIMVNSQKPIDLNYSPQHDNRCKSSQPENLFLDHEYEYLQGINNPYEENDKIDSINNSSQYFLNNEKYCSTPNIQEHLFNDMNIHKTNLYKNEILKVSSSTTTTTTELSSKIVQSTNSNISNNIKETIIEPITYKSVDQITRNHSCHGNRNNKETILSDTNSTKQLTNEKNYETSFVNLQQNRRNNNNPQSNYESLSLININQKLKLIQGSTDIQNSMFQSKISTSLNNLKMKYHHNQSQSQSQSQQQSQQPQPQQRQPQQQNDRRRQSDHNGSKYNCMNQLMNHSNHNSNYQKTIKDKNDLDPHLYHKSIEPPLRQYTLSHSSPLMNQDSLSIKRQYSELLSLNSYTTTNTTTTNNNKITSHLPYYNHDQFKSNEKPYQMLTAITTNTTNNSNSSIVHIGDPSNNLLPQQQQQPQKQQYPNRLIPNDQKHHHPSYLSTLNSIKSSTNSKWINKKNNR
uniref:Mitogen-activated protein kinase n=1 Tax=Schistosoma mansoni TaxID=6183 RepID=A0A3Q0KM34_SCHMA